MSTMQEVSKDTFYATIGEYNVHPYLSGAYPYTSEWHTPAGRIIGKVIPELDQRYAHLFTEHFFVSDGLANERTVSEYTPENPSIVGQIDIRKTDLDMFD